MADGTGLRTADVGRDDAATSATSRPGLRDDAPDVLSPIDENAPVSGHHAGRRRRTARIAAVARARLGRPPRITSTRSSARPGTHGTPLAEIDDASLAQEGLKKHALPLIDPGPADLAIAYALREAGYDVLVNADHLLAWGVGRGPAAGRPMANLAAWSATAPWTDELSGERRLLSSDTGEGATRRGSCSPTCAAHLAGECGGAGAGARRHARTGTCSSRARSAPATREFAAPVRGVRGRRRRRRPRADRRGAVRARRRRARPGPIVPRRLRSRARHPTDRPASRSTRARRSRRSRSTGRTR